MNKTSRNFNPYEGDEPYIFISYCHKDCERVIPLLNSLHDAGYRIWYDEGIQWASKWPMQIATHLANCHVCIAFHSADSLESEYCRKEIHFAISQEKPLLSVFLEDVSLPLDLSFELSIYQQIKLYRLGNAIFISQISEQSIFMSCKDVEASLSTQTAWHTDRGIIWAVQGDVLIIEKSDDSNGKMPNYDWDKRIDRALTPWRKEREDIRSIKIKPGICSVGERAFRDFVNVIEVDLPDTIESLGSAAFRNCPRLTNIHIPNSVISIGGSAFNDCSGLNEIIIPSGVTTIQDHTFADCESLTSILLPGHIKDIGWSSFFSCTNLSKVIISEGASYIGDNAFRNCLSLSDISIPNSVIYIGSRAFYGCSALKRVEISARTGVGRLAFPDTTHITRRPLTMR